jgi:hypothetical protein
LIRPIQKYRRSLTKAINGKIYPILIFILVLSIFFSTIWIYTDKEERSLKSNYKITKGVIYDVISVKGSGFEAKYQFSILGKNIYNQ